MYIKMGLKTNQMRRRRRDSRASSRPVASFLKKVMNILFTQDVRNVFIVTRN